jgi:hypothetical protein
MDGPVIRPSTRPAVSAVLASLFLFLPLALRAQDADTLYRNAQVAYSNGSYRAAIRLLQKAWDLSPDPICLYNLGRAYERAAEDRSSEPAVRMADLKAAADHYRRFLQARGPGDLRPKAQERLRTLVPRLPGMLSVSTPVAGSEILVDRILVGRTPMGPIELLPGPHEVILTHPEFDMVQGRAVIVAEQTVTLPFEPKRSLGTVVLTANVNRGRLFVDERKPVDTDFPTWLELPVGTHFFRVEVAGCHPDEKEVIVRRGEPANVRFELNPRSGPPASKAVPPAIALPLRQPRERDPEPAATIPDSSTRDHPAGGIAARPSSRPYWTLGLMGAGVAIAGGGGILTWLAWRDRETVLNAKVDSRDRVVSLSMAEARSLQTRADRMSTAAVALYTVGGAAVVTGACILIFSPASPGEGRDPPIVNLGVTPRGATLGMGGRF